MSTILDRLADSQNALRFVRDRLAVLQYPEDARDDLFLALKLIDRATRTIVKEQAKIEERCRARLADSA